MAEKFSIQDITSHHKSKDFKKKYQHQEKEQKSFFSRFSFKLSNYPLSLWLSFYAALISSVLLVSFALEKSRLAEKIMDRVRVNQNQSITTIPETNLSSFTLTTDPGLVALITFPSGDLAGIDDKNVRFFEVPNVSMSKTSQLTDSQESWTLFSRNPSSGTYHLDFSSENPGVYSFSFDAYSSSGISLPTQSFTISIPPETIVRYILEYDSKSLEKIKFTSYQAISPL